MISMVIMTVLMWMGVASCSSDDGGNGIVDDFSIVGTWQSTYEKEGDKGGTTSYTEIYTFTSDGNYSSERKGVNPTKDIGKYFYENNRLTLNEWSDREGYASFYIKVKVVSSREMVWTPEEKPSVSYTFKKM